VRLHVTLLGSVSTKHFNSVRRLLVPFYATQTLAVVGWWVAVLASQRVERAFAAWPEERWALFAFLPVDIVAVGGGSLALAIGAHRRHGWVTTGAVALAAVLGYVTAYLIVASVTTGKGYAAPIAMALATAANALCAAALSTGSKGDRPT
jgi:hypothetical protein